MFINRQLATSVAILAAMMGSGCAGVPSGSLSVAEQGSFFVGGRKVQAAGTYDPTKSPAGIDEGQTFWIDQMYVHYQYSGECAKVSADTGHGGSGTGRVWETTPDGREGYQTLMLRHGFPVYIVDFPRRGRAGYPSFNGPFGTLAGKPVVANQTGQAGVQYAWSRWRLGPKYPDVFPVQQFPMKAVDQFMQHLVPPYRMMLKLSAARSSHCSTRSVPPSSSHIRNRVCSDGWPARAHRCERNRHVPAGLRLQARQSAARHPALQRQSAVRDAGD